MHIHFLDQYRVGDSLVHRLDPRVKLILALAFILAVTMTPPGVWVAFALLLAMALLAVLAADLSPGFILKRSVIALPFALAAVTIIFTTRGEARVTFPFLFWHLSVTDQGLIHFASIVVKSWIAVQMAILLSTTTPFPDLLRAMRDLRLPRLLVTVIGFMYRYIFVLADEALRLMRAREARSADPEGRGGGTVLWRARVLGGMVGSLFLRSYERSERIYNAMLSRGYAGEIRTLREGPVRRADVALTAIFLLCLTAIEAFALTYR